APGNRCVEPPGGANCRPGGFVFPPPMAVILPLAAAGAAVGAWAYGTYEPNCRIFGPVVGRGRRDSRLAYLTFDDGPNPDATDRILETLAAASAAQAAPRGHRPAARRGRLRSRGRSPPHGRGAAGDHRGRPGRGLHLPPSRGARAVSASSKLRSVGRIGRNGTRRLKARRLR